MNRKTNLFYNAVSQDSNFITFSNYTESLTGNFLSVDTKLFPSAFLCLRIPSLICESNEEYLERKSKLLNSLVSYYENKMAFLRDYCVKNNIVAESELLPLNYLLECIYSFDSNTEITFVDNITEQDYNGTFTDTICIVNTSKYKKGDLLYSKGLSKYVPYDADTKFLYGWYEKDVEAYDLKLDYNRDGRVNDADLDDYAADEHRPEDWDPDTDPVYQEIKEMAKFNKNLKSWWNGPSEYSTILPTFDAYVSGKPVYDMKSDIASLVLEDVPEISDSNDAIKRVEFNIIIPLFDVIDCNATTNAFVIEHQNNVPLQNDPANPTMYIKNVPWGIWFSGNEPISLKRDSHTKLSTTWSLIIGSQFKPFPYSQHMPGEVEPSASAEAFLTFSQILTRQNQMMDKMNNLFVMMDALNKRMSDLESNLGSMGTSYNMDGLHQELINYENNVNSQLIDIRNEMSKFSLRWVNREG